MSLKRRNFETTTEVARLNHLHPRWSCSHTWQKSTDRSPFSPRTHAPFFASNRRGHDRHGKSVSVRVPVNNGFRGVLCRLVSLPSACKLLQARELVEWIRPELLLDTVEVWGSSPHGPTIYFNRLAAVSAVPQSSK